MLAKSAVRSALHGKTPSRTPFSSGKPTHSLEGTVRPCLAVCLSQIQPNAAVSTSSAKPAAALERRSPTGQQLTASGKVRKEVALPSQEKKEGAMQFVLSVLPKLIDQVLC